MAQLDFPRFEQHLKAFNFQRLFLDVLGWNQPAAGRDWQADQAGDTAYSHRTLAELGEAVKPLREEGRLTCADKTLRPCANRAWRAPWA